MLQLFGPESNTGTRMAGSSKNHPPSAGTQSSNDAFPDVTVTTIHIRSRQRTVRMPRGASPKREREYKKIEQKLEKEGRYKGREKEVAARIVNKQRAKSGETKKSSSKSTTRKKKS
jgi:hypothetical protein